MYQMTSSEVALHVLLAFAAACGYILVQWADLSLDGLFCPSRARTSTKMKTVDVDEVKQAPTSPSKVQRVRRSNTACSSSAVTAHESQEAPEILSDSPAALAVDPHKEEATKLHAESAAVSERVARLLAKKAERKVRKAQERLDSPSPSKIFEQQFLVQAAAQSTLEQSPSSLLTDEMVETSIPAGESQVFASQKPSNDRLCHGVSLAEMSTGDEGLGCQEHLEETGEEFSGEDMDCDVHSLDISTVEQLSCPLQSLPTTINREIAVWTCDEEFQGLFHPVDCDDAWMAPLDDVIRSHEQAEQVYAQVFQDMRMGALTSPVPELHYQPVLCDDNRQFYTDGEQFYLLACIDVTEDMDMSVPLPMRPVVDAHDPLHMEFIGDQRQGLQCPKAQGLRELGPADDHVWDSPWDFVA